MWGYPASPAFGSQHSSYHFWWGMETVHNCGIVSRGWGGRAGFRVALIRKVLRCKKHHSQWYSSIKEFSSGESLLHSKYNIKFYLEKGTSTCSIVCVWCCTDSSLLLSKSRCSGYSMVKYFYRVFILWVSRMWVLFLHYYTKLTQLVWRMRELKWRRMGNQVYWVSNWF